MTANERLRDAAVRHAVYIERYGRGLARKITALLNAADAEIVEKLAAAIAKAGPESFKATRLQALLEEVRFINSAVYAQVAAGLTVDLVAFAQYEFDFQIGQIESAVEPVSRFVEVTKPAPSPATLRRLVTTTPIDGFLLKSWTDTMSRNKLGKIEQAIRLGIVNGETSDDIVRRIRGTRANGYRGVFNGSRTSAQTLVLTAKSSIANAVRDEVYRENSHIIKMVQWVSTLDSRTSQVCTARDGRTWKVDEPHPVPPAHPRCRSVMIPITKSWNELGIDREDIDPATRASMNGQVPAKTTYGDWIVRQPQAVQNEVLGVERARMLRAGEVEFKDLYGADDKFITLDQLKRKEREV